MLMDKSVTSGLITADVDKPMYTTSQNCRGRLPGSPSARYTFICDFFTHPLSRYDRSEISSPHMTHFTLIYLECHTIVPIDASKQCDASQSRYHRCISHAESWCAVVMHVDDDVAILVVDRVQRQGPVSSFCENGAEDGVHAFNDAEVELRLRDVFGKSGEDEAGLGAGDVEGDASIEQSFVLQGGRVGWSPLCSADVRTEYCYFAITYAKPRVSAG